MNETITWLDKPFALFANSTYYPAPGWRDHVGQFSSLEEASKKGVLLAKRWYGWWQVVDLRTLEIVAGQGSGQTGLMGECKAGKD